MSKIFQYSSIRQRLLVVMILGFVLCVSIITIAVSLIYSGKKSERIKNDIFSQVEEVTKLNRKKINDLHSTAHFLTDIIGKIDKQDLPEFLISYIRNIPYAEGIYFIAKENTDDYDINETDNEDCFFYYLTPKGFAEKASLTAQFLSYSYQFYRDARADDVAIRALRGRAGPCYPGSELTVL